jgi:hypothetical protein
MKLSLKSAVAGAAALAIAGGLAVAGGGVANAAASSPFDPASNGATQGSITFYDAAGNVVTHGPLATPPKYAVANTWSGRAGTNAAILYGATPVQGTNAYTWPNDVISAGNSSPNPGGLPASLSGNTKLIAQNPFSWFDAAGYPASFPNTNGASSGWQGLYQVRIEDSGPGIAVNPQLYASATIATDVTAGEWTQVYPVAAATSTTLSASPASPQNLGTNVTFTATVSSGGSAVPSGAGSVQFKSDGSNLGSPVTVGAGGQAQLSTTALPAGTHAITAVFSDGANYAGSTGGPLSYKIIGPADNTSTALSANPSTANQGDNVALTASVSDTTTPATKPVGSVQFYNNGVLIAGSQTAVDATGNAVFTTNGLPQGVNPITAVFTPTDPTAFNGSNSGTAVNVTINAPACQVPADPASGNPARPCGVDPQTVDVSVPAGTLTISTPYGPNNPFHLGAMTLATDGSKFQVSKLFPVNGNQQSGDHIMITDTRAGDQAWTAQCAATPFSSGANTIAQSGLAFTQVTATQVNGGVLGSAAKPVVTTDVASFTTVGQTFATAAHGAGSVYVYGNLSLQAPTSTPAGTYTATVTFTVA